MTHKVILHCLFNKMESMADKSFKLRLDTRELNPEQAFIIHSLLHKEVHVMLKESRIEDHETEEAPESPEKPKVKGRSNSKLLRDIIFRAWESEGSVGEFEGYYNKEMYYIIKKYRDKLNDA